MLCIFGLRRLLDDKLLAFNCRVSGLHRFTCSFLDGRPRETAYKFDRIASVFNFAHIYDSHGTIACSVSHSLAGAPASRITEPISCGYTGIPRRRITNGCNGAVVVPALAVLASSSPPPADPNRY
ncbi:hypothetical protein, partial [Neorhodopirellula lusitana]|uniref:hypothetical protein n=1 Tax=Neorhodopirellula lusitana TaxID=445327 RepID=UPI0024B74077